MNNVRVFFASFLPASYSSSIIVVFEYSNNRANIDNKLSVGERKFDVKIRHDMISNCLQETGSTSHLNIHTYSFKVGEESLLKCH